MDYNDQFEIYLKKREEEFWKFLKKNNKEKAKEKERKMEEYCPLDRDFSFPLKIMIYKDLSINMNDNKLKIY